MDNFKELFAPKTFNRVSYFVVFGWIVIGVIFLGVLADTELNESRSDFSCGGAKTVQDIDLVRGQCFELYMKQNNKHGLPIYGFVILNFFLIASVCAIYSLIVSSTVSKLSTSACNGDEEQSCGRENALSGGKKLFIAYSGQLFTRIVFGVLFMVLQTQFLYPTDFPSRFRCDPNSAGDQPRNSTGVMQNSTPILHDCHNQRATKKNSCMKAILVVNGIFVFVVLMEAVYILIRTCKKDGFMKNSKFLKTHLNPSHGNSQDSVQEFIENTKKKIKKDTCRPPQLRAPFSGIPGEGQPVKHLALDQIYTNLVVVPDRVRYNFTGDRREKLEVYAKSAEKNTAPSGPEDILNHENKKVLIVGRPGIGKTLCCTKVLRDWALNKAFNKTPDAKIHFDVAFFIKFRVVNTVTDNVTLRELLTSSEHSLSDQMDKEVWNYICDNPERVLLIFDGIDEFKHNSKIGDENFEPKFRDRVDEKMPVHVLYEKLASGKLLDGAAVLTTTRPTAMPCIEKIPFDKVYEILGFSSTHVKDYVTKFGEEGKDVGKTLWRHIGGNMNILSLCYIPASCFIICSTLFHMLSFKGFKSLSLPKKLTDIYKKAVKIFYLRHNEDFRGKNFTSEDLESDDLPREVEEKFKNLEKMAFEGIKEGKLIFGGNEVGEMENSALFHRLPDRRTDELNREKQFCFIHLTMQEFFAARHLANMSETELRNFVSENIEDGKWQLVFQFLAGLMNDKEKLPSEIITDLLPEETKEEENELYNEEWPGEIEPRKVIKWPTEDKKHLAVTLFKCCSENSEMKDTVHRRLQQINFNCVNFIYCQLTAVDCASLVTVIENQGKNISHLELTGSHIGRLGCLEICKLLKCRNSQLSWLNLAVNQLTDEAAKYLAEAIRDNNCQLRSLNLADNNITEKGAQHLAEAISNENCQLRTLILAHNNIRDKGAQHLAEAINNENCQLRTLNLAHNNITDKGAQHLAEAINNENCQLRTLILAHNNIRDKGAQHLAEAINNENCQLRTLHLAHNNITDKGAQHLAEAINNENCQLRTLILAHNNITDKGAQHLAEAINNENCQLRTLILAHNNIRDKGAQHLAEAISNENCQLRSLLLRGNNITEAGKQHAENLLSKSQSDCFLDILHR